MSINNKFAGIKQQQIKQADGFALLRHDKSY